MARFYGAVGYGIDVEKPDQKGVYVVRHTERNYYGDILKKNVKHEPGEHLNDNVNVSHRISIVADEYAYMNIFAIRYVVWMGAKWKVTDVEVERPRLILSIGGVYNGTEDGPSKHF